MPNGACCFDIVNGWNRLILSPVVLCLVKLVTRVLKPYIYPSPNHLTTTCRTTIFCDSARYIVTNVRVIIGYLKLCIVKGFDLTRYWTVLLSNQRCNYVQQLGSGVFADNGLIICPAHEIMSSRNSCTY